MAPARESRLDHTGNLLGALALALSDRTADAAGGASGLSTSGAAALSALHHFLDRPSVGLLRQVLGLTASGTVRLLDRLEDARYVERGPGDDGRSVAVLLTPAGRTAAEQVSAARARVLREALAGLSRSDRDALDRLLSDVLAGMIRGPRATPWMCRLCDTGACGRNEGRCPVANAARRRFGNLSEPNPRPR